MRSKPKISFNRFSLAVILVFLKFIFDAVFVFSWQLFDPLLIVVIMYAFFHSFDMFDYIGYAIFCGLLRDVFSLDSFGVYTLTYLACVAIAILSSRLVYRHNWIFIFPVVFLSVSLSFPLTLAVKSILFKTHSGSYTLLFFTRSFCESFMSVVWTYPLYFFSKKCACELIA